MNPQDGRADFAGWAGSESLLPDEQVLIEKFLSRRRRTLEAGTGGGRILLELAKRGFSDLHGFDFVPEFIELARMRDPQKRIQYAVENACALSYPEGSFEQLLYLQQVLCFIECPNQRKRALDEAFRILAPGGIALLSLLCFEGRWRAWLWRAFVAGLMLRRRAWAQERPRQLLPWLRRKGSINWRAFSDRPPYAYWFRVAEAEQFLVRAGFTVIACGTTCELARGVLHRDGTELLRGPVGTMLYFACRK